MKTYTVTLATMRLIHGSISVEADSQEDAIRAAVGAAQTAAWPVSEDGDVFLVENGSAWASRVAPEEEVGGIRFPSGRSGMEPVPAIKEALILLSEARELLKAAGAERSVDRVRLAITSTEGALRHARNKTMRAKLPDDWAGVTKGAEAQ